MSDCNNKAKGIKLFFHAMECYFSNSDLDHHVIGIFYLHKHSICFGIYCLVS